MNFVFFGTDEFAVRVLETLADSRISPGAIVTTPDQRQGRGLKLESPPVKIWAQNHKFNYLQPENLNLPEIKKVLAAFNADLFIIASYGKIIPAEILAIPSFGVLNIHPSILPAYRGPTPIQTAILAGDESTGVSIMQVDAQMDHGPILAQEKIVIGQKNYLELREELAILGAKLIIKVIPEWLAGTLKAEPQDHTRATQTKKINKEAGQIDLTSPPELNLRKFRALTPKPGLYFFTSEGKRVKITVANLENGQFIIKKVIPEGKKEINWQDFLKKSH